MKHDTKQTPTSGRRWAAGIRNSAPLRRSALGLSLGLVIACVAPAPVVAHPADCDRPTKLTAQQVKEGVRPHLPRARACGPMHGAVPGQKVAVKLDISGATGRVSAATAVGAQHHTALGACVAGALHKATFPPFTKSRLGVLYPVRMPHGMY